MLQDIAALVVIVTAVRKWGWWQRLERKTILSLKKEWRDKWVEATLPERVIAVFVLVVMLPPVLVGLFAPESAMAAQIHQSHAMQSWSMAAGALVFLLLTFAGAQAAWRGGRKLLRR